METCGNCNGPIGQLERPRNWHGQPVCFPCYERLKKAAAAEDEAKAGYVDSLAGVRTLLLILAAGATIITAGVGMTDPMNFILAGILWAAWAAVGIISMTQKDAWNRRHGK